MDEQMMEIDLLEIRDIIFKRKWLIIFITLISTMAAVAVSFFLIKPIYESRASIVVGKEAARIFYEDKYTNSDIMMYQRIVKTYAEIAKSDIVVQKTADSMDNYTVNNIRNLITVVPKTDTQILEFKAKSHIPADAARIANECVKNFIVEANKVLPAGELNILDEAKASYNSVSPNKKLNIAIGFILGFMVSLGMVFLLEYFDKKIRKEEQIKQYLGIPVLASISD